jgi:DNA-binding transcriptional regulator YiaG
LSGFVANDLSGHIGHRGGIHDGPHGQRTLCKYDEICLTPVKPLLPEGICAIRLQERASQAVFARHLNVTVGLSVSEKVD